MTEVEFESRVFNMLYALTDNYPAGVGPSCVDVSLQIVKLSREVDHTNVEGRADNV